MKDLRRKINCSLSVTIAVLLVTSVIGSTKISATEDKTYFVKETKTLDTISYKDKDFINFLKSVDLFVEVKDNSFVLNENSEFKNIVKNYSESIGLSYEKVYGLIINRIRETNKKIVEEYSIISEDKNILKIQPAYWNSQLGHEVENKWWGARHILRNQSQVNDYVYKLRLASIGTGIAMLVPGVGIVGGITTAYFNLVALDIEHYSQKHGTPFNFDVAWSFNYNFTEVE